MKLLLDTYVLLLAVSKPAQLPSRLLALISHPHHTLFFSAASIWEVAYINSLTAIRWQIDISALRQGLLTHHYQPLAVSQCHLTQSERLPLLHTDPFDRLLISQAIMENCVLLSLDHLVSQYASYTPHINVQTVSN